MKKILMLMLCLAALASATSCGKKDSKPNGTNAPATATEQAPAGSEEANQEAKKEQTTVVDNGTIGAVTEGNSVKVILPVTVFGENAVEIAETIKVNRGFEDAVVGDDGYITFTMTKEQHEAWKADAAESAKTSANQLISDVRFVGMKEVIFNEDYTQANIITQNGVYKSERDAVVAEGIANSAFFYQSMSGKKAEELAFTVNFVDEATNEIIETVSFPKA